MNWQKIEKKYPKSFHKLVMSKTNGFNEYKIKPSGLYIRYQKYGTRDLYDFFYKNDLICELILDYYNDDYPKNKEEIFWKFYVNDNSLDLGEHDICERKIAEKKGLKITFSILEDKLKEEETAYKISLKRLEDNLNEQIKKDDSL